MNSSFAKFWNMSEKNPECMSIFHADVEFAISMPFSFLFIFSFIFFLSWLKRLLLGVVQDWLDGCAAHCWMQNDFHSASLSLGI